MLSQFSLSTSEILAVFDAEITSRGGQVTDTFNDGRRLFSRSILPEVEEVRPGDGLQGGIALKATEQAICLFPYLFRQVCRNGAILAETIGSRSIEDLHLLDPEAIERSIRAGVEACCAPDVFSETIGRMRRASASHIDIALNLLPMLTRFSVGANEGVMSLILERFFEGEDNSQFGLVNAVTSVARDMRDPELRWRLEEFGGGIAIASVPDCPADDGSATIGESRETVLVG